MSVQQDRLGDLRSRVTRIVRDATGLHERLALPVAESICGELAKEFRGGGLSVPSPDKAARDAAVRRAFTGSNHAQVCGQHGISRSTLYRIIRDEDLSGGT